MYGIIIRRFHPGKDRSNMDIIIGNICSLLAMVTDSVSSTRKTAKGVLLVQSLSQIIYCAGAVILRGYSAAVQNAVSVGRNLIAIRGETPKWLQWLLVALGVVLGLWFNNLGFVGLLPVIANLEYSLAIFRFQDNERALKLAFLISVGLYGIFNIFILNIVGVLTNSAVVIMTAVYLIRTR